MTWTVGGPDSNDTGAYFTPELLEAARGNNNHDMMVPQGKDLIGKKKETAKTSRSNASASSGNSDNKGNGGASGDSGSSSSSKSKGGPKWLKL